MTSFAREYEQRFSDGRDISMAIQLEALRLNELLDLSEMTENEILQTEIPEGQNFVQLRCNFNGQPSSIRVINNRGNIDYVVDFRWDRSEIRERLDSLALLYGRIALHLV